MKIIVLQFFLLSTLAWASGLVAVIQPELSQTDYQSDVTLLNALSPYFDKAVAHRNPNEPALMILPEYTGAWLVAVNSSKAVFKADNLNSAMTRIILAHPFRFTGALIHTYSRDHFSGSFMGHVERAIFKMQAEKMLRAYVSVFAQLARKYQTWIVAGSTILPEISLESHVSIKTKSAHLFNQSFVFNPDGDVVATVRKVFPVGQELEFMDRASLDDLTPVDSPFGKLGVLVCADSWHPECYQKLESHGVDILIVPSLVNSADRWIAPWGGYDPPEDDPGDVDPADLDGQHPENAMWKKYALRGRMTSTSAVWGFNSFLVGNFWGVTGGGQSNGIKSGEIIRELEDYQKGGVLTFTLP